MPWKVQSRHRVKERGTGPSREIGGGHREDKTPRSSVGVNITRSFNTLETVVVSMAPRRGSLLLRFHESSVHSTLVTAIQRRAAVRVYEIGREKKKKKVRNFFRLSDECGSGTPAERTGQEYHVNVNEVMSTDTAIRNY